jgi:hypothetical protein
VRNNTANMMSKRFGFFPRQFIWKDQEYLVEAIEKSWTTGSRKDGGRMQTHHFMARCAQDMFELRQDIETNHWYVDKHFLVLDFTS